MLSVEQLTPAGTGALTVLRLTGGPLPTLLTDRNGRPRPWPPAGRHLLACLSDGSKRLDEALVLGRPDGAELHLHGGEGTRRAVTALCRSLGAQLRQLEHQPPPASLAAARALASAQHGPLSRLAEDARAALRRGTCDADLGASLARALRLSTLGRHLAQPPRVRIVGRPNAGKSTLFNALLGRRRALVSPLPGTTRDTVGATLALRGVPVQLEDSAGQEPPQASPAGAADLSSEDPAELLLHLLRDPEEPTFPGPRVLAVRGRIDQHDGQTGVSGLTGQGLAELAERLAERLGLSAAPGDHVWAPARPGLVSLLRRAQDLPLG